MNGFTSRPLLSALTAAEVKAHNSSVQLFQLECDGFGYTTLIGDTIYAGKGLITDFASIPRVAWDIISPQDIVCCPGSIIHDDGYSRGGVMCNGDKYTRDQIDLMLRESILSQGGSRFIADSVYEAVHLFGASHWGTTFLCRPPV